MLEGGGLLGERMLNPSAGRGAGMDVVRRRARSPRPQRPQVGPMRRALFAAHGRRLRGAWTHIAVHQAAAAAAAAGNGEQIRSGGGWVSA